MVAKVALPSVPRIESWAHDCLCPDSLARELWESPLTFQEPQFPHLCNEDDIFQMAVVLGTGWGILSEVRWGLIGAQRQLELMCFPPERTSRQLL